MSDKFKIDSLKQFRLIKRKIDKKFDKGSSNIYQFLIAKGVDDFIASEAQNLVSGDLAETLSFIEEVMEDDLPPMIDAIAEEVSKACLDVMDKFF